MEINKQEAIEKYKKAREGYIRSKKSDRFHFQLYYKGQIDIFENLLGLSEIDRVVDMVDLSEEDLE